MPKKWWKARGRGGNKNWDPKVAKAAPTPRPHDDLVTEYVSVILKKLGEADDDDSNLQMLVAGTMTFEAFLVKTRQDLGVAADIPLQWFVGPRRVAPDSGDVMSSFPKHDYLHISYYP